MRPEHARFHFLPRTYCPRIRSVFGEPRLQQGESRGIHLDLITVVSRPQEFLRKLTLLSVWQSLNFRKLIEDHKGTADLIGVTAKDTKGANKMRGLLPAFRHFRAFRGQKSSLQSARFLCR